MSLSIYCTSCGSPTNYTIKKPSFCSGCGKAFQNIPITATPTKYQPAYTIEPEEPPVPKIQSLDIKVMEDRANNVSLRNMLKRELVAPNPHFEPGQRGGLSKQQIKNIEKTLFDDLPAVKNSITVGGDE